MLTLLLLIVGVLLIRWGMRVGGRFDGDAQYISGGTILVLCAIGVLVKFILFGDVLAMPHRIAEQKSNKAVYARQADAIIVEMSAALKSYVGHEASVFDSLSDGRGVFLKYPELKAHKPLMKMAEELQEYREKAYRCDIKMNEFRAERPIHINTMIIF